MRELCPTNPHAQRPARALLQPACPPNMQWQGGGGGKGEGRHTQGVPCLPLEQESSQWHDMSMAANLACALRTPAALKAPYLRREIAKFGYERRIVTVSTRPFQRTLVCHQGRPYEDVTPHELPTPHPPHSPPSPPMACWAVLPQWGSGPWAFQRAPPW